MKVYEIMKDVITIDKDKTLKQAAAVLVEKGIGCLIICEGDTPTGIITERDVLKNICKDVNLLKEPVGKLMSSPVLTVEPEQNIDAATDIMNKNKIKKVPVIDDGKLVGIVTSTDIVAHSDELDDMSVF